MVIGHNFFAWGILLKREYPAAVYLSGNYGYRGAKGPPLILKPIVQ